MGNKKNNYKIERSVSDLEHEIVSQIMIIEVCFDICKYISEIEETKRTGRGSDFVPFYYNLNFTKAIISLYSLLASNRSDELTIKNYINRYKNNYSNEARANFEIEINNISNSFKNSFSIQLRHKVSAHLDLKFRHSDFDCAYILPEYLDKYIEIVQNLKKIFFKFCNWSLDNYSGNILSQSKLIINKEVEDSGIRQ